MIIHAFVEFYEFAATPKKKKKKHTLNKPNIRDYSLYNSNMSKIEVNDAEKNTHIYTKWNDWSKDFAYRKEEEEKKVLKKKFDQETLTIQMQYSLVSFVCFRFGWSTQHEQTLDAIERWNDWRVSEMVKPKRFGLLCKYRL